MRLGWLSHKQKGHPVVEVSNFSEVRFKEDKIR